MKQSKSGIEEAIGVASAEDLQKALSIINSGELEKLEEDSLYKFEEDESEETEEMTIEEAKELVKELRHSKHEINKETLIQKRQKRLQEISDMGTKYFEDIMDKAFESEDKHAADIFTSASNLLKIASDAEKSLIDSETKMAELQLKKEKQDLDANKMKPEKTISGETTVMDRNSLLNFIKEDK